MERTSINSILLFLLAPLVSVVTTYLFHIFTSARDLKKYKNDQTLQDKKLIFDEAIFRKSDLNKSIEEIYRILFCFEHYVSLTSSVIDSSGKLATDQFDKNYRQESESLARLKSLVFLKFPQYSDQAIKISSHHNNYWGHQRLLLNINIDTNVKNYRKMLEEIIKISNEIQKEINDLVLKLQDLSVSINVAYNS